MATIKVLNTATGCWSAVINGLDKEFFVKSILSSCFHHSELYNPTSLRYTRDLKDADRVIERLELDFHAVKFSDILRVAYYDYINDEYSNIENIVELPDDGKFAEYKLSWSNVNTDIHSLMVSLGILKALVEDYKTGGQAHLVSVVEAVVKAGDVPADASDDHVLILKFN